MSSEFPKEVVVAFSDGVEGFDSDNIVAKQTDRTRPGNEQQFRSAFTEWRVTEMISRTVDGLDITSELGRELTELSIPFEIDIIPNVPFTLNAQELNDPSEVRKKIMSALKALSARLNRDVFDVILTEAGQTVVQAGALASYEDIAAYENALLRQDLPEETLKTLVLNLKDHRTVAGNLAARSDMGNKVLSAYERSLVSMSAGFDIFRTSYTPKLAAAAGAATVTGAQSHIPRATDPVPGTNRTINVDNRFFELTVSDTTGMKPGDAFTAGVNEVSLINKEDTDELRTFTIRQVIDGTTIQISPAPVNVNGATLAEQEYGNVTDEIANGEPLVFVNTADAKINAFWENDNISINIGNLAVEGLAGVNTMTDSTDSGVQLVIAYEGKVGNFTNQYRVTGFWGVTMKEPMKAGRGLANQ